MGLSVRATPRRRGEACSSRTRGESRSVPSSRMTGGTPVSVREGGKGSEVAGWAGGKEVGRRMEVFWAVERKENGRRRKGAGPAGLKVEEEKRKAFHF